VQMLSWVPNHNYANLCEAAKNEQHRQTELQKQQLCTHQAGRNERTFPQVQGASGGSQGSYRCCYSCGHSEHAKKDCKHTKSTEDHPKHPGARTVRVDEEPVPQTAANDDPYSFLESSFDKEAEDDARVRQIRVKDSGSVTQCVKLCLQGVPVYRIIDSGADITIIGGQLFKCVALVASLKKKDFDKTPRAYDHKPFTLDGKIDLDIEH